MFWGNNITSRVFLLQCMYKNASLQGMKQENIMVSVLDFVKSNCINFYNYEETALICILVICLYACQACYKSSDFTDAGKCSIKICVHSSFNLHITINVSCMILTERMEAAIKGVKHAKQSLKQKGR